MVTVDKNIANSLLRTGVAHRLKKEWRHSNEAFSKALDATPEHEYELRAIIEGEYGKLLHQWACDPLMRVAKFENRARKEKAFGLFSTSYSQLLFSGTTVDAAVVIHHWGEAIIDFNPFFGKEHRHGIRMVTTATRTLRQANHPLAEIRRREVAIAFFWLQLRTFFARRLRFSAVES